MNSKFLKALPVIALALVATAPLSHAKAYTPAQFTKELKLKVGNKTGPQAYNAAASLYKAALQDKANKKYALTFTNSVVALLKKPSVVPQALQGKSVNTLIRSLQLGYFAGLKFSITDAGYTKSLSALLRSLPPSQKSSQTVSNALYSTVKGFLLGKQVTQLDAFNFYNGIAKQTGVKQAFPS